MTKPIASFSSEPRELLRQLRSCDEADISGRLVDVDLDGNWAIDMVRKLQHWDVPGYLSRNAYHPLQALCDFLCENKFGLYTLEYIAVISGQDDVNDTWRTEFDCANWTDNFEVEERKPGWPEMCHFLNYEDSRILSIPMYAEGYSCYLVVWARPIKTSIHQPGALTSNDEI